MTDALRRAAPYALLAALVGGVIYTSAQAHGFDAMHPARPPAALAGMIEKLAKPTPATRLVWEGADVDGDGQADFANPTGHFARAHDSFGDGEFGASRDGGVRRHEGVDFISQAGQAVVSPISGFVTKIGFAYADNQNLRFVEVTNPALHYAARVFYIAPEVTEGQPVRLGAELGKADSLQARYPGITDHVHLELMREGRRFDAQTVITARLEQVTPRA